MEYYTPSRTMQGLFVRLIISNVIIIEQLWQTDIDGFGSSNCPIPSSCPLKVYADDNEKTAKHLEYSILLKGITPPWTIKIHRQLVQKPSVSGMFLLDSGR